MISIFERELEEIEREVRDLKTIHQRGLGTVQFYEATSTKTILNSQGYASFSVDIASGEPTPSLIIPAVNIPQPLVYSFVVFSLNADGDHAGVTVSAWTPGQVKLKVISSSIVGSIT